MRKRLLCLLIMAMMSIMLTACGDDDKVAPSVPAENKVTTEEVEAKVADKTEGKTNGEFTILDVTPELVDSAIYSIDDADAQYIITLFHDPDHTPFVSMIIVADDGSAVLMCGAYNENNISQVENEGVTWTTFDVRDAYTGDVFSVILAEADDESVAVANSDFSIIMEGRYLSGEEAVDYMGTVIR